MPNTLSPPGLGPDNKDSLAPPMPGVELQSIDELSRGLPGAVLDTPVDALSAGLPGAELAGVEDGEHISTTEKSSERIGDISSADDEKIRDLAKESKKNVRRATVGRLGGAALLASAPKDGEGGWVRKTWGRTKSMGGAVGGALHETIVTAREKLGLKSSLDKNSEIMKATHSQLQEIGKNLSWAWYENELEEDRSPTPEQIKAHSDMVGYALLDRYDEQSALVARGREEGGLGRSASQATGDFLFGKERVGEDAPKTTGEKIKHGLISTVRTAAIVGGVVTATGAAVLIPKSGLVVGGAIGYLKAQRRKGNLNVDRAFMPAGEDVSVLDKAQSPAKQVIERGSLLDGTRSREARSEEFGFESVEVKDFLGGKNEEEASSAELDIAQALAIMHNSLGDTLVSGLSVLSDKNRAEIHNRVEKANVVTSTTLHAIGGLVVGELIGKIAALAKQAWGGTSGLKEMLSNFNAAPPAGIETPTIEASTVSELGDGFELGEERGSDVEIHTPEGDVSINLNAADGQGDAFNRGDGVLSSQEVAAQLDRVMGADVGELPQAYDLEGNVINSAGNEAVNIELTGASSDIGSAEVGDTGLSGGAASEVNLASNEAVLGAIDSGESNYYGGGESLGGMSVDQNVQLLVNNIINPDQLGNAAIVNGLSSSEAIGLQESLYSIGGTEVFGGDRFNPGALQVKTGVMIDDAMRQQFEQVFDQYQGKIHRLG